MKKSVVLILSFFVLAAGAQTRGAEGIEKWAMFEITLSGPSAGNPFSDVLLTADFASKSKKITVTGFYDGKGLYKIRFMPTETGEWSYVTKSSSKTLNNKTGSFSCVNRSSENHGPVTVSDTYHFKYADGKQYYPFGTTIYAWTHQPKSIEEQTLRSLAQAPFNKVRMCVFPKSYTHVDTEPEMYPYEIKSTTKTAQGVEKYEWDFTKFNPEFFQHLEKRISDLDMLGIEADLIIFHPYDKGKWGFDNMGKENDLYYIKYLIARLAAYKNVWWSMANEFDYIKTKPRNDWDDYSKAVVANDPYRHLCSIHNGSVYYDNWKPEFTHVSIQNGSAVEDFGRALLLRDVYFKPVIYDEVCYEGDITSRWGRLSGEEMTEAFWQGMIAGTYVTHGETLKNAEDLIFWAEGGRFNGTSPARIGFLRKIIEEGPGPLQLADPWKDHQTAQADSNYYIIYFGRQMQNEWILDIPAKNAPPAGTKLKAEIIDTWNMTITPVEDVFELGQPADYRIRDKQFKKLRLPMKPYLAIRLTRIK